jgi:hypothetical protein
MTDYEFDRAARQWAGSRLAYLFAAVVLVGTVAVFAFGIRWNVVFDQLAGR